MDESLTPWFLGVGAIASALALGLVPAMTAFMGRVAFQTLDDADASRFLRAAFPIYYRLLIIFTLIGASALALARPIDAGVLFAVAITALFARVWLLPIANRLDDLKRGGQDVQKELLQIQGRTSFVIVAQIIALTVVVVRLAVV